MRDDLVQQLSDTMLASAAAALSRGRSANFADIARAVLASGLVVPTSDVLKKISDWDHGHVLPPRFVRELRALTQQEPR